MDSTRDELQCVRLEIRSLHLQTVDHIEDILKIEYKEPDLSTTAGQIWMAIYLSRLSDTRSPPIVGILVTVEAFETGNDFIDGP